MSEPRKPRRQAKAKDVPSTPEVKPADPVDPIIELGVRRAVAELWGGLPLGGSTSPLPSPSAQRAVGILERSYATAQAVNAPLVPPSPDIDLTRELIEEAQS